MPGFGRPQLKRRYRFLFLGNAKRPGGPIPDKKETNG
jgi:hypothetical protein